ncbi:MAG: beta-glucuronidase [Bacteroidales bacterium]|nr:beta-glucuronidase [Bacteroidales bacterium]
MSTKIKTLCILSALVFCLNANAGEDAPYPQIINISRLGSISLDGEWKYLVDPYALGYQNYHGVPHSDYESFFADRSFDDDRTRLVEYSFDRAHSITVPGDWNTQSEKLYYYEGKIWYRKTFDCFPKEGKRYFLYFGAVNYSAVVALNGRRIARHEGGFTPFNIEVTGMLRDGSNSVVLLVDNTRQKDGIPTDNTDWWNYGGITRSVRLVETPGTFIRDYAVLLDKNVVGKTRKGRPEKHRIYGHVQIDGSAEGQPVNIRIPELGISLDAVAGPDGKAVFETLASPVLWSPENPRLYDVRISIPDDVADDRIGFRYIETSGDKVLLNGKPVFFRGVSIHEESLRESARVTTSEQGRELLEYARELGCNFVRLAHYPHNEEMVRQAEEMGLLVWSEIPVYWAISWTNPATYANAEQQLVDMIKRDINRANVVIWSVANETPISPERTAFLSRLIAKARELDPTRLVSAAMEKHEYDSHTYIVDDPLLEYTDLVSFNQYVGWYTGGLDRPDEVNWKFSVQKPVFISEFGAGALYGNHGPVTERFTEEYMAECYERNIRMMSERMPGFCGTTPWVLKDFRSPRRALIGIQDDFNRKGVISENGERKKAFYVLQNWYRRLKDGQE